MGWGEGSAVSTADVGAEDGDAEFSGSEDPPQAERSNGKASSKGNNFFPMTVTSVFFLNARCEGRGCAVGFSLSYSEGWGCVKHTIPGKLHL